MESQAALYKEQLPKPSKLSLWNILMFLGSFASILAIVTAPAIFPTNAISIVYSVFLCILVLLLLIGTYIRESKKLHRYADATLHLHFANHLVRDYLSQAQRGNFVNLSDASVDILNSIARAFSIVTGKSCRCCIKTLQSDLSIDTLCRDSISKINEKYRKNHTKQYLYENTDFENLWYARNGCSRYFISNNLPRDWKNHNYVNSSFDVLKQRPEIAYGMVCKWRLPYKSTIVLPLRYVPSFTPPIHPGEGVPPSNPSEHYRSSLSQQWTYWGFLCIDCGSTGVFDETYAPELGAAFADILYIFYSQVAYFAEQEQSQRGPSST